jgi:hypothetical protein
LIVKDIKKNLFVFNITNILDKMSQVKRDFLAMDVHQYHGNSTLVPLSNDYLRLTFVCYLRKGMHLCKGAKVDNN